MTIELENLPTQERDCVRLLIRLLLEGGNTVSVYDGQEYCVKRSSSEEEILSALNSSGEDMLAIRNAAGEALGFFYLIYDNGSEADPFIVVSDYSDNRYCEGIYSDVQYQLS